LLWASGRARLEGDEAVTLNGDVFDLRDDGERHKAEEGGELSGFHGL
jgi:hypothetical protein